jgi:hypothetical protein
MIWVEVGEVVIGIALMAISAGVMIMLVAGMEATSSQVEQKAVALLQPWLSPEQAEQYSSHRYFEVIGSDTGKRYRIRHGRMMNVDELDSVGNRVCEWCFLPEGQLAAGDVMLAQKIALETFESQALAIANRSRAPSWHPDGIAAGHLVGAPGRGESGGMSLICLGSRCDATFATGGRACGPTPGTSPDHAE